MNPAIVGKKRENEEILCPMQSGCYVTPFPFCTSEFAGCKACKECTSRLVYLFDVFVSDWLLFLISIHDFL